MNLPYPTTKPLADALERRGYEVLTPVQLEMMRPDLIEADLLVSAQTGSGKTVGFGLAIAPTLLGASDILPPAAAPLALIIAPTRELALQVKREFQWLYQDAGVVMASCVGGMDMRDERRALDRGAHIVVATPGRLRDHIMRGSIDLGQIRAVVLDEADEMLDLGFKDDLEFILSEAPETRRTLMFSATVPRGIAELSKTYLKDNAVRVATTTGATQHADIEYRALTAAYDGTEGAIINLLRYYEAQNAIVFCNTRATVSRLVARFANRGFSVVALSGELSQAERTHALQAMRDGRARVCVATDVAARGIDLPNLELVIHAELPTNSETLMHRSGRTGRAGRKGVSALVVTPKTRAKAERLLKFAKITAEWALPPSADEVRAKDEERLINDPVWSEPLNEGEEDFVARIASTYTAEQIAGAYLRLFYSRHSAPEELPDPEQRPERKRDTSPRKTFGPSSWLKLSVGANERAEARWLLPTLCKAGDITRDDIGAIRVQADETYVELLSAALPNFLKALGPDAVLDGGAKVVVMDNAPDLAAMPRVAPPPREERGERKPHRGADRPERSERPVHRAPPPAEAAAWADVPDRVAPVEAAPKAAGMKSHRPKPADDRSPPAKPAGFKSNGFKSHGGAPRDGAKPARSEGMKSHTAKPRSDKPREMDPAVHRGFDSPKPRGDKPYGKPGAKPGDKPYGSKSYAKPTGKPGDKPYGKPAGKAGDKPYGKPGGKPGAKPFGKPGGKPWEKSGDKPAGDAPVRNAAANTSARLGPGGKPLPAGKGAKPRAGGPARGPNAVPRRKP
ncbi:MAG: DEAD/DEAH box helicase [Paracoccaceae bacterium]|nr:DEAD/DEAH box helicase [Paracoccaceae bacterium]